MPFVISASQVLTGPAGHRFDRGAVLLEGSSIVAVGSREDIRAKAPEAPELAYPTATIIPGLINAHVHLTDSLSNLPEAVGRLVAALEALDGLENMQVSGDSQDEIVAQSGAGDPGVVRLQVKENRKLSPAEVAELVDAYQAGTLPSGADPAVRCPRADGTCTSQATGCGASTAAGTDGAAGG